MMKRIALTVVFLMFWDLSAVFAFQFPVSELNSFKTENDFLIFAGIVYDKAEIFLTSRKIKINNIATNIAN